MATDSTWPLTTAVLVTGAAGDDAGVESSSRRVYRTAGTYPVSGSC